MKTLYISESENGPTRYLLSVNDGYTSIRWAARTNPHDGRTMYSGIGFRTPRLCMNALFRLLMGRSDWKLSSRRPAPSR